MNREVRAGKNLHRRAGSATVCRARAKPSGVYWDAKLIICPATVRLVGAGAGIVRRSLEERTPESRKSTERK